MLYIFEENLNATRTIQLAAEAGLMVSHESITLVLPTKSRMTAQPSFAVPQALYLTLTSHDNEIHAYHVFRTVPPTGPKQSLWKIKCRQRCL
jgi:hypothetical protein